MSLISFPFNINVAVWVPVPKFRFGNPRRLSSNRLPEIPDTTLIEIIKSIFYYKQTIEGLNKCDILKKMYLKDNPLHYFK